MIFGSNNKNNLNVHRIHPIFSISTKKAITFFSQEATKDKIQLFPDSVFVFGSKEKLSKIHFVESENTVEKQSISNDINIQEPENNNDEDVTSNEEDNK